MRGLPCIVVVAACGSGTTTGARPAPAAAPPSARVPEAPTFVVIDGDWTGDELGGPYTSALAVGADDEGVSVLIGGALMTRASGGTTWTWRELNVGGVIHAELEGDAVLLVGLNTSTVKSELVYLRDGQSETIASGCDNVVYRWVDLIAPDVITYGCHDERVVARRTTAGWETIATPPAMLMTGAVGDDGTVYLLDATLIEPVDFFVVRDDRITASIVPDVDVVGSIVTCAGGVYATFEQGNGTALGRLDGTTWTLETVQTELADSGMLALDEACHPFVAVGDQVYSRSATGWIPSSVGSIVKDLAAHDGHLYAIYDDVTDSVHAGFAEATLRPLE